MTVGLCQRKDARANATLWFIQIYTHIYVSYWFNGEKRDLICPLHTKHYDTFISFSYGTKTFCLSFTRVAVVQASDSMTASM